MNTVDGTAATMEIILCMDGAWSETINKYLMYAHECGVPVNRIAEVRNLWENAKHELLEINGEINQCLIAKARQRREQKKTQKSN